MLFLWLQSIVGWLFWAYQPFETVFQSISGRTKYENAVTMLEGDVSDVIAKDQLMSLFSPRKATGKGQQCHPNFLRNTVFQYTQYTHVSSAGV